MKLFAQPILVPVYVCVPRKAGTHLVRALFEGLGLRFHGLLDADAVSRLERPIPKVARRGEARPTDFALSHVPPPRTYQAECEAGKTKIVLGLRDPRAVLLSTLDFLDHRQPLPSSNWHAVQFFRTALGNAFDTREKLAAALLDSTWLPDNPYDVCAQFARCRLLYHHPGVFKLKYEDILAAADTGDGTLLGHICNYLGISVPADAVKFAQSIVGSSTATKNKGVADRWKTELSPTILKNFMDRYGSLVAEFGYPVD